MARRPSEVPRAPRPAGSRPPRRGLRAAAALSLFLFGALVLLGATGAAVAVTGFLALSRDLPDPAMLEEIEFPEQSIVYDRTGETELARFGEYRRTAVTFAEIPPVLIDATTAVEDGTFWENAGFDPLAIVAAGIDTLRGRGRGASTITQQLVRQRLLDRDLVPNTERSVERKLKEIVQSIRLTQAFPGEEGKRRIIAAYLNQNYYGNDAYGVAAAAERYFAKGLDELTLAEAAILAAIPQAPSDHDLVRNAVATCVTPGDGEDGCAEERLVVPDDAPIVARRNLVLDLMASGRTPLTGDRYTAADFRAARQEPVVLAPQDDVPWRAPQFVHQVRRELAILLCGEGTETCPILERGGLRVTTTLDLRLQGIAERWVKAATIVPHAKDPEAAATSLDLPYERWMARLRDNELRNGALVALDYQTGELIAYVGSADPSATTSTPAFQPRFDVLSSGWRQPGSAFKPIVYATGIDERRITAATMFMDVVADMGGGYTPANADGLERGPVRVTDALRFSLNVPAVKALAVTGIEPVIRRAEAFGLAWQDGTVDAGLSFALGVEEVRPVDLVGAYGALANGGRLVGRTAIRSILGPDGGELLTARDRVARDAVSPQAAAVVTHILAGNTDPDVNPFWGAFRLVEDGRRRPATLKTGTNTDARDLNAYGYLAAPTEAGRERGEYALAVGAWNGNSDNSLVSGPDDPVYSIDVTTHVWQGFLREATAGWEIRNFTLPDGLVEARVDPWTGLRTEGRPSVVELFLEGTVPSGAGADRVCGEAVLAAAPHEAANGAWLAANRDWIARAGRGPGVRGGPERSATSYFYNGRFTPYGRSWGPLLGGDACASPSPSASPSGSPSASPSASPSGSGELSPSPSEAPTAEPTPAPTAPPTPAPTAPPTPAPTADPTPPPASPSP